MGQSRTKVSGSLRTIMHFSYFCGMNEEIVFKYFPELDARQREQMAALGQLYAEWNARINVISRKDMDSLYLHHVLHSLTVRQPLPMTPTHHPHISCIRPQHIFWTPAAEEDSRASRWPLPYRSAGSLCATRLPRR